MPRPTSQDLAGFWDLLQLSVEDVTMKFDQLQHIQNNNWRPVDSPEKKVRSLPGTVSSEPRQLSDTFQYGCSSCLKVIPLCMCVVQG